MQAIYFPKQVVSLGKDEKFQIECNHDEYSLWFDVHKQTQPSVIHGRGQDKHEDRSLGMTLVSRNRLSQLNDLRRNQMFVDLMKKVNFKFLYIAWFIFGFMFFF